MSGSQLVTISILKNLDSNKYEKYILCGLDEKNFDVFSDTCLKYGINLIILKNQKRELSFLDFNYFFELIFLIKLHKFNIVHTNSSKPGLFGRVAAKFCKVGLIVHTVHGISFHRGQLFLKRFIFYALELFGGLFSNKIILVNNYYKKYYKIFGKKIITIYNGLLFQDCPLNVIRSKSSKIRILFLSRFESQKDPISFLKAILYLKINHNNLYNKISVKMVGDGDLISHCLSFKEINELDVVDILPWASNKWDFYSDADIFCVPSIHEAFGIVFLEAGYMSIPVVSTLVEGIPEVVINGVTGLLSEPRNYISLANNILELLEDEKKAKFLGNNARKFIMKEFNFNSSFNQYLKIYSSFKYV